MSKKRVLILSALFPPNVLGGAETSAFNIAKGFVDAGWEVGVVTTAATSNQVCDDRAENGMRIWRLSNQRPYTMFSFADAPKILKPIWHLQDHFDPRNRKQVQHILDRFQPDVVNIHILQGLGYNILHDLAQRDIPTVFFQHDMGLACIRMSMFKNGANCQAQCTLCKMSSVYKLKLLQKIKKLHLLSPSAGNFLRMQQVIDLSPFEKTVALNPNTYPAPTIPFQESSSFRVLYAGRLHQSKGVQTVIRSLARMAATGIDVRMDIAGAGPYADALRHLARDMGFVRFHGHISQQELSDLMQQTDLIVVPSIWTENSPGVLIHALSQGLPALGSNTGGIPELIEDGKNGFLLPPDDVETWQAKLTELAKSPAKLAALRSYALSNAERFDPKALMRSLVELVERNFTHDAP